MDLILKNALGPALTKTFSTYFTGFAFGFEGCPCLSSEEDELCGSNTLSLYLFSKHWFSA